MKMGNVLIFSFAVTYFFILIFVLLERGGNKNMM